VRGTNDADTYGLQCGNHSCQANPTMEAKHSLEEDDRPACPRRYIEASAFSACYSVQKGMLSLFALETREILHFRSCARRCRLTRRSKTAG